MYMNSVHDDGATRNQQSGNVYPSVDALADDLGLSRQSTYAALNNGTMQVFTGAAAQAALTEMTAGNYVANVLNDTIIGEAFFAVP